MDNPVQKALFNAVRTLLRPLVRILLRNGIAYGSFAELAKKTYVDVAFEEFRQPGKKQTISHVSAITGLTRKETKRLHELAGDDDLGAAGRYNRAVRVVSGWLNDPRYQSAGGVPLPLPLEGEQGSFTALVKQYSGDIPTQAMLAVLEGSGTVAVQGGQVVLLNHAYIPGGDPVDKLHILGTDTGELIDTIDHNLTAENEGLWFQRKVYNDRVDPEAIAAFRKFSTARAQTLLEELDTWLAEHETQDDQAPAKAVSLGIYYHEKDSGEEESS